MSPLRVLVVHNHYRERGGEDAVFEAETALLRKNGVDVVTYEEHSDRATSIPPFRLAVEVVWSRESRRRLAAEIERVRPDVVHFHNPFPLISPSAYYACRAAGVAVVQRLPNYRILCPGANLVRDGRVCQDCLGRSLPWPALVHGCYRGSRPATASVASMIVTHRLLGTWERMVDVYVPPSEFARSKFIEGGLPADRIVSKPNFVDPDPGIGTHDGGFALYAGRLSEEKGVATLLRAWKALGPDAPPLRIAGDGPLATLLAHAPPKVEWLGRRSKAEVFDLMRQANVLIFPSDCFESFGLAIAEAYATGLPVIASRHGAMAEIVDEGRTGLLFDPGDANSLATRVRWALAHPDEMRAMGRAARLAYEERYTAARAFHLLEAIYEKAIHLNHERRREHRTRASA